MESGVRPSTHLSITASVQIPSSRYFRGQQHQFTPVVLSKCKPYSLCPRGGSLRTEPERGVGEWRDCPAQRRGEDSLSPGAPGAETLPVASLACNSSLAATGCGENKAKPHFHVDAERLRAALRPALCARTRNHPAAAFLAPSVRHLRDPACPFPC